MARKNKLLECLSNHPEGQTMEQIVARGGAKNIKSGYQGMSYLRRKGYVISKTEDGYYTLESEPETATKPKTGPSKDLPKGKAPAKDLERRIAELEREMRDCRRLVHSHFVDSVTRHRYIKWSAEHGREFAKEFRQGEMMVVCRTQAEAIQLLMVLDEAGITRTGKPLLDEIRWKPGTGYKYVRNGSGETVLTLKTEGGAVMFADLISEEV